jgi:predicted dienelactone hydrolase
MRLVTLVASVVVVASVPVVAAPAFAYAFTPAGLRDVRAPNQLWRAADDHHQPHPFYEESVRAALPQAPEYRVIANAGHYDFLAPCSARLSQRAPGICTSLPGFDRAAFHERFNAEVARFFQAKLR